MAESSRDSKLNWTKHVATTSDKTLRTLSAKNQQTLDVQHQVFEHIRTKLYNDIHGVAQLKTKAAGVVEMSAKIKDANKELDFFK